MTVSGTAHYRVRAHNASKQSENRIHADDVARLYGFKGGLVPGVTVYAYMTRPAALAWGADWVERGTMSARFLLPLYEGEEATVEATPRDGEALDLRVMNEAGDICATGAASLPPVAVLAPDQREFPEAPLPDERPVASPAAFGAIEHLGSFEAGFRIDRAPAYLEEVFDDLPLYGELAHPAYLLLSANTILTANVRLGPWIHVSSDATHFAAVRDGDRVSTRGNVTQAFERKGHRFVDLDVLIVKNQAEPVMSIRHRAIYEIRRDSPH